VLVPLLFPAGQKLGFGYRWCRRLRATPRFFAAVRCCWAMEMPAPLRP